MTISTLTMTTIAASALHLVCSTNFAPSYTRGLITGAPPRLGAAMVTPGGQHEGLKYLTSTPYNAASSSPYGPTSAAPYIPTSTPYTNQYSTPVSGSNLQSAAGAGYQQVQQQFQQLQTVEETSWETPACGKVESKEMQERREENYQARHAGLYLLTFCLAGPGEQKRQWEGACQKTWSRGRGA